MTDEELEAEMRSLQVEHAELESEHRSIREDQRDTRGHLTHAANLRRHIRRLHTYIAALDGKRAQSQTG